MAEAPGGDIRCLDNRAGALTPVAGKWLWTGASRRGWVPDMDLHSRYPGLSDLKARARRRIPHFVWEFFDSGTGTETTLRRNRIKLDEVLFHPAMLQGDAAVDLGTSLLGRDYPVPFGISPVGMSGLIWPGAERLLAAHAAAMGIPYGLSTVATEPPETVGPHANGQGWFQLYPPRDPDIRRDMLARARDAGFETLVLTVDVPVASRRERQTRGGLVQPPRLTPRLMAQVALCPAWAMATLQKGLPRMRMLDAYTQTSGSLPSTAHAGYLLRSVPDWTYLDDLRREWAGKLVVKGVMDARYLPRLEAAGVDAIWVSNHAGRQFDGALSAIEVLPEIRAATDLPVIFDSGVEGGLDILRALALGANFVMMARAWHYALGALGPAGPRHLHDMLVADMTSCMGQVGARNFADLSGRLVQDRTD